MEVKINGVLTVRIYGRVRRVPIKGNCRKNVITTGKKSLEALLCEQNRGKEEEVGKGVPKEIKETKSLHYHPNEWSLKEHQ